MNFKEWWNNLDDEDAYRQCKAISEKSWDACKNEVLKILNRENHGNINDLLEDRIKEIRKL